MRDEDTKDEETVIRGTITELRPEQGQHPHLKWLAVLDVDSVVKGRFLGKSFAFHIHSPTKSGIAVGGRYELRITPGEAGTYLLKDIGPWNDEPVQGS